VNQSPRRALDHMLSHHEPYPALVMNSYWEILRANPTDSRLMAFLLNPPATASKEPPNVLRLLFYPGFLRP